jgi:hypothetical protein
MSDSDKRSPGPRHSDAAKPGKVPSAPSNDLSPRDAAFVARVAGHLERTGEQLDGATRSRLRRARAAALARRRTSRWWSRWLSPGASAVPVGVAAALVLALMPVLWRSGGQPPAELVEGPVVQASAVGDRRVVDLEIMLEVESLDMIEDLEFFEWLAGQPEVI